MINRLKIYTALALLFGAVPLDHYAHKVSMSHLMMEEDEIPRIAEELASIHPEETGKTEPFCRERGFIYTVVGCFRKSSEHGYSYKQKPSFPIFLGLVYRSGLLSERYVAEVIDENQKFIRFNSKTLTSSNGLAVIDYMDGSVVERK
jgi:hypothetical protein